jgi:hypothetical protein
MSNPEFDFLIFFGQFVVLLIYGAIFIVSIIFTFFINTYNRIDEFLSSGFIMPKIMNPLERNIDLFDDWLVTHNKIIGPLLSFLSLIDIFLLFKIIEVF